MQSLPDNEFIVNVGPGGTFRKSGNYQTIPEDIDAMFARFRNKPPQKIALYFHGGLVNETNGLESARNIQPYLTSQDCVPVCFVWETGLMETISTNISKISSTRLYKKLINLLIRKLMPKLAIFGTDGRSAGGSLSEIEVNLELQRENPFQNLDRERLSGNRGSTNSLSGLKAKLPFIQNELYDEFRISIETDLEYRELVQDQKLAVGGEEGARGFISVTSLALHASKIGYRVVKRFIEQHDHDFYPTVVEELLREIYIAELGAWVWKAMKDKAARMWSKTTETGLDQQVGWYFLDKLNTYKKDHPDTEISLVGHSAGSIAICHLLAKTAELETPFAYNHILLMAPACRIELFNQEVLQKPDRYQDIRIFTMNDSYECKDLMIPYFYTHSLLYLISGILEDQGDACDALILGLERHLRFYQPYNLSELSPLHHYLYDTQYHRLAWSVCADDATAGMRTCAKKHGDFDDDIPTLESIAFILA